MDKHTPEINGALLRMRREELGWALPDLATRACLSNKQVKQIEEGGTSSFYSESVKVTAAKKVGGILGLPEQSIFVMDIPELDETQEHEAHSAHPTVGDEAHVETASDSSLDKAHDAPDAGQTVSQDEQKEIASSAAKPYLKSPSIETTVIQKSTNSALDSEDKPKPKNSLWYIIALFVAALGLAAVMQQPASTPSAEPPPPIQVLPADQADPAASAPTDAASGVAPSATATPSAAPVATSAASATQSTPAPAASVQPSAPTATPAPPAAPSASKAQ